MDTEATPLELSLCPVIKEYGRNRRFSVGDRVVVKRGGWTELSGRVLEWRCDPHPPGYEHCCGNDAAYRIEGVPGWTYDWQLERGRPTFQEILQWLFQPLRR